MAKRATLSSVFLSDMSGALTGSVCCGKGTGCYQNSIKNFSALIPAWGASTFYRPSGWANFPSMIPPPPSPDRSGWSHGSVSSHTAFTGHGSSVCCTKWTQVTGWVRWTSLWETSALLKTRSHLCRTIRSTFLCKLYKAHTHCWGCESPLPTWKLSS